MVLILTWLNGALSWIIFVAVYIVAGLVGWVILRRLQNRVNTRIPIQAIAGIYVGLGLILVVLMIPGSLGLYYQNCLPTGTPLTEMVWVDTGSNPVYPNPALEVLQQKLIELGGHCAANTLFGADGKSILFEPQMCAHGFAPGPGQVAEWEAQRVKFTKLESTGQYTVLDVDCPIYDLPVP